MPKMIFVNLPVADVEKSAAFYEAVGATKDERFCQENSTAMMMFSDTISFMLLSHERFADFTPKTIPDAKNHAQVLIALTEESPSAIDATIERAVAAGGRPDPTPRQEMGDFMYGRSFEDPDGHIIELAWMDVEKAMAVGSEPQTEPA
ncbi:lactoylglutathione lyase [Sphingomonas gilva]|uniref:Lactoylglutathione lyase n=1 Tax=Sphingomonas gilva TaxID=2305907 RepID=A0A396RYR0_9SPHN|nr:VOC family protein [Sphingomonas gilva]RHW18871.1 lactoylglutathione lyase [Sphingomonas gilva]